MQKPKPRLNQADHEFAKNHLSSPRERRTPKVTYRIPVNFARTRGPIPLPVHAVSAAPLAKGLVAGRRILDPAPLSRRLLSHRRLVPWIRWIGVFCALAACAASAQTNTATVSGKDLSFVIEAAGQVEYSVAGHTNWQPASAGVALGPGDRLRTLLQSRAAVQLSDRSVLRLNERTTLEILPPRHAEKRRFGLPRGSIYFFNRERPADVEFDTPLAAGAIRGTEFLLEVTQAEPGLRLALIDGLVALQTSAGQITVERGEELSLAAGQPARKTPVFNTVGAIQWALYYPAVLNPDELQLSATATDALREVLANYRAGDLLAALTIWPTNLADSSSGARSLHAALELAVGRVDEAETLLAPLPTDLPGSVAMRELIAAVKGQAPATNLVPRTSSEFLARTYSLQRRADLPGALAAARHAVELAPQFGFASARLGELEFAFGNRRSALAELNRALGLSPRLAPAYALRGFVWLEQGGTREALAAFDRARELDAAIGTAWLGRGLCLLREREFGGARAAFQAAAALEPQRALFRSYLGKAASELGDVRAAEKEFALAKRLDPNDPTAWLYSALHLWQQNRLNEAILDLERSADLNDQRAPFRSRLLLDADRSVRSANLAALYDEAGFADVSRHTAARSVAEDYANFSGHLFLANSYAALEDVNRFNLRLEPARESELLVANLLAPIGAGNLSQLLSQQEHLQFFDPRPIAFSSLTQYGSGGDWRQAGSFFGTVDGLSYALDANYEGLRGQRANNDAQRQEYAATLKQRLTTDDDFYFQAGYFKSETGDVADNYDPSDAILGFRAKEKQEPTLLAGWHHAWSPGSHTLALFGWLNDRLTYTNPQPDLLFLVQSNGVTVAVSKPPFYHQDFSSDFTLYSGELQQIWETELQSLVLGGRWQSGQVNTHATISDFFGQPVTDQQLASTLERGDVYGYYSRRIFQPLQLIGGVSYSHLTFPENTDLPPISDREARRDLVSPKAGLLFSPWDRGLLRATYTRSLGGLFFDQSVRLEPAQVAGFNQAFRSLIPESVAGLVPGARFETAGAAFDQSFPGGTWLGVETEWLTSHGDRTDGALTNSLPFPFAIADSPSSTQEELKFREVNLSAYVAQLMGDYFSVNARYRVSDAHLTQRFPDIPDYAQNLALLEQDNQAILHQVSLAATFTHPSGIFAQWESAWYYQHNFGYSPALAGADFWQHNLLAGYRFPRRYAEIRFGLLNLFDTDYRLNPLNLHPDLSRARTFTASLRLNF